MLNWLRDFYWNLPEWSRYCIIIWFSLGSFTQYLKNVYIKKDFTSAAFYMFSFALLMFSLFNHLGSSFNLISGGK